jgi:hypothetical protein
MPGRLRRHRPTRAKDSQLRESPRPTAARPPQTSAGAGKAGPVGNPRREPPTPRRPAGATRSPTPQVRPPDRRPTSAPTPSGDTGGTDHSTPESDVAPDAAHQASADTRSQPPAARPPGSLAERSPRRHRLARHQFAHPEPPRAPNPSCPAAHPVRQAGDLTARDDPSGGEYVRLHRRPPSRPRRRDRTSGSRRPGRLPPVAA